MRGSFNYSPISVESESIDVENVGNCMLEATDALERRYYLVIKSDAGFSKILTFGPVMSELKLVGNKYSAKLDVIEYKDTKLFMIINKFLHDGDIKSAREISEHEARASYVDLLSYMLET